MDPLVKIQFAQSSIQFLTKEMGFPLKKNTSEYHGISYNIYEGIGHTTNQKELDDIRTWLGKAVPK